MAREKLGSRLGFILLSAGCAIGIGNVWKFPYLVGENGGGAFVLIYLFFLAILGIPVMTMEFAIGRASQKSPVHIYRALTPEKKAWHWQGYMSLAGNIMLMMFYTTVAGWMINYFVKMLRGDFVSASGEQIVSIFNTMLADPGESILYMVITVILGFVICSFSLQGSVEKVTKWMMLALLAITVVLAVNSIFTEGGKDGLIFYLKPNFARMQEVGISNVVVSAMNQSFFTLSIGIGSMAIFGSYLDKQRALLGEAVNVALLDTFVAISAGLIIFPACSAYGVDVNSGPPLIFITLPNVFKNMASGRLWGSLFFLFMSFAALSTIIAVFENIISCLRDLTGWSRKKASLLNFVLLLVLSTPCALGSNLLASIQPLGSGSTILDLEDFIVSNLFLPTGSFLFVLYCVNKKIGWGWDNFIAEANTGKGMKVRRWMRGYMTYGLPVIVLSVLLIGLEGQFGLLKALRSLF